jgi:hypothetical protein
MKNRYEKVKTIKDEILTQHLKKEVISPKKIQRSES